MHTMIGHQQQKRKNYVYEDVYEEENVDDLEFAAKFAIVTSPTTDNIPTSSDDFPNQHPATNKGVNNKLDQEADKNELLGDSSNDEDVTKRDNGDDNDDDDNDERNSKEAASSEDDESDVDLSQELAKMDSDDEDEPKHGSKRNHIVVPTTQNELDVYNCPVTELEKTLDLGLEIGDALVFEPDESGVMIARVQEDRIRLAGNIKFHMVPDRTIVVESNPHGGVAAVTSNVYHSNLAKKPLLLDEGNLLLLKVDRGNEYLGKIVDYTELRDNDFFVIPLGKILEVFGPVSKPLYTLRLTKMMTKTAAHPFHDRACCKEKMQNIEKEDEQKDNDETPGLSERVVLSNDFTGNATDENKTLTKEAIVTATKTSSETVVDHNNLHQEQHKVKASVNEHIDPWSESGMLTKWLKASPHLEVFYCEDQVKIVDTQTILKNSRKGCDASNIYDEEVTDEKEVYYSDDEEERAAKRGNRRQNKSNDNRGLSNTGNYGGTQYPSGKHHYKRHPRTNPPYLRANPSYNQHQVSQNQQSSFYPYQYSHPNPNVPTFAPQPIRQDHYTQFGGPPLSSHSPWMQPAPPAPVIYTNMMNSGSIPPPPPPPPPRLGQQQQPYYSIPQSQHQMHNEPSQQHNYQQNGYCHSYQHQQQHQLNQENTSSANNGDTVYYNYSGS
mmetsp:Transcript_11337/g.21216  ORF Transcript_11337/g.21216 Transcript_11337/m.21216 type:complete len:666 (-) Transcript_11337:1731-3728(-)